MGLQAQLNGRLRRSLLQESGLSDSDYQVLVILSAAPQGLLRAFALIRALQWEESRLSHHLRRMEQRGLVERLDCETDGRGSYVAVTPAGRSAIESAAPGHVAEVRRSFFDALTASQIDSLSRIGDAVLSHLAHLDAAEQADGAKPRGPLGS